jgi:acetyl esterase/lipase
LLIAGTAIRAENTSANDDRLKRGLKLFPEADADKDGVLTEAEARAFLKKNKDAKTSSEKGEAAKGAEPTFTDVHYGPHERNVLDFWKAKSDKPAPLVVFIHGGGFVAGDKSKGRTDRMLQQCLDSGVSFAAINYRYRTTAPIQEVLRDCARAIQFIRSKSGDWNVDKARIASYGGSAGAGSSLWLAFHDDLADPTSTDPVLRESSRLVCAGANACQFSYDILEWEKVFGADAKTYQKAGEDWPSFYGLKTEDELRGPAGAKLRADCDMRGLISKDDPPVFLSSGMPGGEITSRGHMLHHPKHAQAICDRCRETGVGVVAQIPGAGIQPGESDPADLKAFLFKNLRVAEKASAAAE